MKKLVLLIAMMLAIAGVYAQGVNFCTRIDLKQKYYKIVINSITSGTAPFEITLNGYQVPVDSMFAQYGVNNILTIRDANNNTKSDTIYEANPNFHWDIGYFNRQYTGIIGNITYRETGINIRCSFEERYNYIVKWYRESGQQQIGCSMSYESVPDSIRAFLFYRTDETPVGSYAVTIRDTVHDMDTLVFVEITSSVDTTTTDTTTTDTTQHLKININVEFYPNPTSDFCNTSEMLREVCIFSSKGDLVRVYKNTNRINLSGLPAGNYLIRYTTLNGKTTNTKKIIKE